MSITNLTNTKWYFNEALYHNDIGDAPEEIMLYPGLEKSFNVTFDANNKQYIVIDYYLQSGPGHGSYLNYINSEDSDDDNPFYPAVWEGADWSEETGYASCGWNDESYRTITITGGDDVTNPDLITWITANAVPAEDEPSGTVVSYNNTVIATIQPGETATLECAGMKMDGNIVIEAAEASGGGVEIPLRTITYEVGEGFNTVKLRYMTVENGSLIDKETEASANSNGSISLLSGAGCDIESTPVTNAWTGEESYPNIETNTGRYVGGNGADYSIIHISGMNLEDHLEITTTGGAGEW